MHKKDIEIRQIEIEYQVFENVENCKDLGVMINKKHGGAEIVNTYFGKGAYWQFYRFIKKQHQQKDKLRIYRTTMKSIVSYAAETICLPSGGKEKLRQFERGERISGP